MTETTFEEIANRFYKDTGFLAPGKDDASGVNREKRIEAWERWVKRTVSRKYTSG